MTVVALTDADFDDVAVEKGLLAAAGIEFAQAATAAPDDVVAAARDAEGLLVQWSRVDAELMERLPRLRVIGRFGTGLDPIDVEEASRRGIAVVNSGHYATEDVAAHTVALALSLIRHVPQAGRSLHAGKWEPLVVGRGVRRLSDITVGVVGLGHIGQLVARHFTALGLRVVGFDSMVAEPPDFVSLAASLDDLLRASDVVSLHVPLLPETANVLSRERLALLPPGAIVVNTARGGLVDEDALQEALTDGRLGGAGLDVFAREPLPADNQWRDLDNVLITPHIAYYSDGSLLDARARTVDSLIAVIRGLPAPNLVNPGYAQSAAGRP